MSYSTIRARNFLGFSSPYGTSLTIRFSFIGSEGRRGRDLLGNFSRNFSPFFLNLSVIRLPKGFIVQIIRFVTVYPGGPVHSFDFRFLLWVLESSVDRRTSGPPDLSGVEFRVGLHRDEGRERERPTRLVGGGLGERGTRYRRHARRRSDTYPRPKGVLRPRTRHGPADHGLLCVSPSYRGPHDPGRTDLLIPRTHLTRTEWVGRGLGYRGTGKVKTIFWEV